MNKVMFILFFCIATITASPYTRIAAFIKPSPNIQNNETQADSSLALITSETPDKFGMIKSLAFCIGYGMVTDYFAFEVASCFNGIYRKLLGNRSIMGPWFRRFLTIGATCSALYVGSSYFNTEFQALHDTLVKT